MTLEERSVDDKHGQVGERREALVREQAHARHGCLVPPEGAAPGS